MLPRLEALLRASPKVASFYIVDNDPIDEANFLFKLRCELRSGHTLQIRLHGVAGYVRYSYQEFGGGPLRRWDGRVVESTLRGDPVADLTQVLDAL